MNQQEITRVGNELIAAAASIVQSGDKAAVQSFFDNLPWEAEDRGADESMPLGWVAEKIVEAAEAAGINLDHAPTSGSGG